MNQTHQSQSTKQATTSHSDLAPRPFEEEGAIADVANAFASHTTQATSSPVSPPNPNPSGHSFSRISIQPKLTIGEPNDPYEQEADHVAEQVMRMPDPVPAGEHQGQPTLEGETLQCKEENSTLVADSHLENQLNKTKGEGNSLPDSFRSFIEPRMGFSFENVKVHTDSTAVQMNSDLNAQAFTHGSDVYFGSGKYNPNSDAGKELLAHELTHVVQQTGIVRRQLNGAQTVPVSNSVDATYQTVNSAASQDIELIVNQIANALQVDPNDRFGRAKQLLLPRW